MHCFPGLRSAIAGLILAAGFVTGAPHLSAAQSGTTYLLAVGICPPYREDIPVELCRTGVNNIVDNFGEAFGIAKANIITLTDEESTAIGFLNALADLRGRLTSADRLILYLNAHGDAFGLWANYYGGGPEIGTINRRFHASDDYVLVFWTKEEPTVPALALAEKDWLTVSDVVDAIDALPAKVALILESCSSGRVFSGFHIEAKRSNQIDFVLASAGSEQVSNLNTGHTMPLFTESLVNALNLPMVRTFGEAVDHARMITVLQATALCATLTISEDAFAEMMPGTTVPNELTHDGLVTPPLWLCAQVPSVADFSGEMSAQSLYRGG